MKLFSQDSLDKVLSDNTDAAVREVDNIPQDQFLASSDADILASIVSRRTIEPLTLSEDHARMTEPQDTSIKIRVDRDRYWPRTGPSQPVSVPGTAITVTIPYTGDYELWALRTNPSFDVVPDADVLPPLEGRPGILAISLLNQYDATPESIKRSYDSTLDQARWFINTGRSQVERAMRHLPKRIKNAIAARRARLAKHAGFVSILNIPLVERPGAPSIMPIRVEPRIVVPLPPPPRSGFAAEPGIAPETYEKILMMLRHTCRTFERTPRVFFQHPEEDLRDLLLAYLNVHFLGAANGEVFRNSGKTDIMIEEASRAAFVGECKIWQGPKKLDEAIDQLLGYLTWRDCKAALVLFNKTTKGFSQLLDTVPKRLHAHPSFISATSQSEPGEWRVIMRSAEDEARRITVQVLLFNVFVDRA